jgi:oxygen-independent coproporphyrinogen-3 oxidase
VEQLHFGGGTPTYLDDAQLRDLMAKLATAFCFDDSDERQFSIEVDPRTVDGAGIRLLADLGFNRLSLGVQDFDDKVQRAVNRLQSVEQTHALVDAARESGFRSISFDLIYGLPHQTVASFDRTLDTVIDMRPDRFAVYNYAHLPQRFKGQRMINAEDIPLPDTKLEILGRTIQRLTSSGYVYIGMDHFALPGDELVKARREGSLQRNFQGYSTHRHCDLISLGVSSISHIGDVYAQNSVTTMEYEDLLEQGRLPVRKGIAVDADDLLRAQVIQALMCYDALAFDDFDVATGIDFRRYFAAELERLGPLADDGLIVIDDDAIRIQPKGRLLLRNIAMTFDRYLADAQHDNRFSRAI